MLVLRKFATLFTGASSATMIASAMLLSLGSMSSLQASIVPVDCAQCGCSSTTPCGNASGCSKCTCTVKFGVGICS